MQYIRKYIILEIGEIGWDHYSIVHNREVSVKELEKVRKFLESDFLLTKKPKQ